LVVIARSVNRRTLLKFFSTRFLAKVQDFGAFSSGREFAAFLEPTPREHATGGQPRLGRITKMGDRYSHASCWFRARAPRLATAKAITTPCAAGRAECSSARPSSTSSTHGPPRLQGVCRECGWSVCCNVSGLEELFLPAKMEIRAFRSS
jgi:hypothetical protein